MADHHAECQRPHAKQATLGPERGIIVFLRRVDLALVLPPCDGAVRIDHTHGDLQAAVGDPLRAQNHGDAGASRGIRYRGPRALEENGIWRRCFLARPPITRDEALRKADDNRALTPRVSNRGCCEVHGVVRCRRHADVREGNTDVADEGPPLRSVEAAEDVRAGGPCLAALVTPWLAAVYTLYWSSGQPKQVKELLTEPIFPFASLNCTVIFTVTADRSAT